MKMKKILALVLSLGLLTGCSSNNEATTSNEEIVTEITAPVEITFWHAMNGAQEEIKKARKSCFTLHFLNLLEFCLFGQL